MEKKPDAPLKKDNFQEWWQEILGRAEIVDNRYPVKGLTVWHPSGFALRRRVYDLLRSLLDRDHQETLFPLLIPEDQLAREAAHIKGFEKEVYWVTRGGGEDLEVPLALRPTSETAIYPMFQLWVRSHADLPIRIYQIVNVFRHETKHTRPLIRLREITSFKEAHTVHATWEEADAQVQAATQLYREFFDHLGVPYIITRRPDWDKFPGADYSVAFDTMMPDGRTLQIGTIHHLGDHFARTFHIQYEAPGGERKHAHQTCYGISERCIAALLATHGDDRGLQIPPTVAPIQAVVIPITYGENPQVLQAARGFREALERAGVRARLDERNLRPGEKYYHWEFRGVPLRVEIGPKDLQKNQVTLVRRDTLERTTAPLDRGAEEVQRLLREMGDSLRAAARRQMESRLRSCATTAEARRATEGGVAWLTWCGQKDCAEAIETETESALLGLSPLDAEARCVKCGAPGKHRALLGRAY
ncbi:MAG: proline--tRNA ligase [Euryarchaeota archaeon]|nr:proline--tRNA ligase [Euryarchaeota archaeon]